MNYLVKIERPGWRIEYMGLSAPWSWRVTKNGSTLAWGNSYTEIIANWRAERAVAKSRRQTKKAKTKSYSYYAQ